MPPKVSCKVFPNDSRYSEVFNAQKTGSPDSITKAGCLALARLGKDAWNAWRERYPVPENLLENIADFRDVDFRTEIISFNGFEFGDGACFENAQFGDNFQFDEARFGNDSNFSNTHFGYRASFFKAKFGNRADFSEAYFGDELGIAFAQFGEQAQFCRAIIGNFANFAGVQFFDAPNFQGSQFGSGANFSGVQLGQHADFTGTQFGDGVDFTGLDWPSLNHPVLDSVGGISELRDLAEKRGLSPESFNSIDFSGARFIGRLNFSGRTFKSRTYFGRLPHQITARRSTPDRNVIDKSLPTGHPVTFGQAPLFHNCKIHQDTTFDGAEFPLPSTEPSINNEAGRAYRTLKLAFAQQQATRQEQDFFRLEMIEEAACASWFQRGLFFLYRQISDFGFSLLRPSLLLLGTFLMALVFYGCIYQWKTGLSSCLLWQDNCQFNYDLLQFGIIQSLPLPGLEKWGDALRGNLFSNINNDGTIGLVLTVVMMLHKTVSLLALFLIGLALRNLFKMK